MKLSLLAIACAFAALSTQSAFGQENDVKNGGDVLTSVAPAGVCAPIPDNTYRGGINTVGQAVCKAFTVPGVGTVNNLNLQLGLTHTWVGDLVIKVQNPARTKTVTVMSRPGVLEAADDGISPGSGDSSNLLNTFPITFGDSFATSAEALGNVPATLVDASVVCRDLASPCSYQANPGAAVVGNLATFNGDPVGAGWQVCVGDRAALDIGDLCAVTPTNGGAVGATVLYTAPPATLSFPVTAPGATNTANVPVAATAGNSAPLNLSQCTIAGTNAADFSVTAPVGAVTVAAGTTTNVVVRFAPTVAAPATRTATLTCPTPNATAPNATSFAVALSGAVTQVLPAVIGAGTAGGAINFGQFNTGQVATRTFVFNNTGPTAGDVTCTLSNAPGYSLLPAGVLSVPANGSASYTVSLNTASAGSFGGTLTCIGAGLTGSPVIYTLSSTVVLAQVVTNIPALSETGKYLMFALMLGLGVLVVNRQRG